MTIALLNRRVELLTAGRAPDGAGGETLAWVHKDYLWAGIERLAATRDFAGDRRTRLRRLAARIRRRPDIRLGERLRVDGAEFEIASIESEGLRDRRLVLVCEEVAA